MRREDLITNRPSLYCCRSCRLATRRRAQAFLRKVLGRGPVAEQEVFRRAGLTGIPRESLPLELLMVLAGTVRKCRGGDGWEWNEWELEHRSASPRKCSTPDSVPCIACGVPMELPLLEPAYLDDECEACMEKRSFGEREEGR